MTNKRLIKFPKFPLKKPLQLPRELKNKSKGTLRLYVPPYFKSGNHCKIQRPRSLHGLFFYEVNIPKNLPKEAVKQDRTPLKKALRKDRDPFKKDLRPNPYKGSPTTPFNPSLSFPFLERIGIP